MAEMVLGASGCATKTPTIDPPSVTRNPVAAVGHDESLAVGSNQGIMWGVNGHPRLPKGPGDGIFARTSFAEQMQELAGLGLRHYRIDLYTATSDEFELLTKVLAAATPHGVVVTPILIARAGSSPEDAYRRAYDMGLAYATRFKKMVRVWEIGNEENSALFPGFHDGSNPATFKDAPKYPLVSARLRGLIDGVRSGDPSAKVAAGDAGGCNYAFTEALWSDGLRWDITVFHPYDFWGDIENRGTTRTHCAAGDNMVAKHAAFGKPLWLTEFSFTLDVTTPNKTKLGLHLVEMMKRFNVLAKQYDIEAADIYELYDQDNLRGAEAHFGIFDSDARPTDASTAIQSFLATTPSAVYALAP